MILQNKAIQDWKVDTGMIFALLSVLLLHCFKYNSAGFLLLLALHRHALKKRSDVQKSSNLETEFVVADGDQSKCAKRGKHDEIHLCCSVILHSNHLII